MNLSKGPPQAPLFSVWIVAKKTASTNLRKIDATHLHNNMFLFVCNVLIYFVYLFLSLLLYLLLCFNVFLFVQFIFV